MNPSCSAFARAGSLLILIAFPSTISRTAQPHPTWPQFRGPNCQGVADAEKPPIRFAPDQALLWKLPLPPGVPSPCIWGDRIFDGRMSETWQQPTGVRGIPLAILIDPKGRVAWIGSPDGLKSDLVEEVLTRRFDLVRAATRHEALRANQAKLERFQKALEDKKLPEAEAAFSDLEKSTPPEDLPELDFERLGLSLLKRDSARVVELAGKVRDAYRESSAFLHDVASMLAATEGLDDRGLAVAEDLAERAIAASSEEDPRYLATLARVQFLRGRHPTPTEDGLRR